MVDLSSLTTESRNLKTTNLDSMTALEIVSVMNSEDKKVPEAINKILPDIALAAEAAKNALENNARIVYVGAGTSGRLGVLDAVECMPTFGVSNNTVIALIAGGQNAFIKAVEGAEDDTDAAICDLKSVNLSKNDFVIGIAASGRTPYVCSAIRYAASIGCHTAAVTCNPNSPLGALSEIPVEAVVGPEILTGSTRLKAGTAQKMILNMISTAAMVLCGRAYKNLMVDVICKNEKLLARAVNIVIQATGVDAETAADVLKKADGNAKLAITMILSGTDEVTSEKALIKAKGHVNDALFIISGKEK